MKPTLNIIYTNIGRGHPYYLDGIIDSLNKDHHGEIELNITDVFQLSRGLSKLLWKMVGLVYKIGSQGGAIGKWYGSLRENRNPQKIGLIEKLLARGIRKYVIQNRYPTIVAHPILVAMIADLIEVYYQHGEIAFPIEAAVQSAKRIYLPLQQTVNEMAQYAPQASDYFVSGLCLPRAITETAEKNYNHRLERLQSNEKPIGAFFTSGAEPIEHLDKIVRAVNSLATNNYRSIIVCQKEGTLEKLIRRHLPDISFVNYHEIASALEENKVVVLRHQDRESESLIDTAVQPHIDYYVAPSHERTNWAVGLGLPAFILHPIIGTFSPLNRRFLLDNGVALDIDTKEKADKFAGLLQNCATEKILISMAQNGWNKYPIDGFDKIAKHIIGTVTDV